MQTDIKYGNIVILKIFYWFKRSIELSLISWCSSNGRLSYFFKKCVSIFIGWHWNKQINQSVNQSIISQSNAGCLLLCLSSLSTWAACSCTLVGHCASARRSWCSSPPWTGGFCAVTTSTCRWYPSPPAAPAWPWNAWLPGGAPFRRSWYPSLSIRWCSAQSGCTASTRSAATSERVQGWLSATVPSLSHTSQKCVVSSAARWLSPTVSVVKLTL